MLRSLRSPLRGAVTGAVLVAAALLVGVLGSAESGRSSSSTDRVLLDVAAVSNDDVWAVGAAGSGPLIEHWDGRAWTDVPAAATSGPLFAVEAVSRNDVWALGRDRFEHWNGAGWNAVPFDFRALLEAATGSAPGDCPFGEFGLADISAVSANDIWAVGWGPRTCHSRGGSLTLSVHWDGTSWAIVPSPNVAVGEFYSNKLFAVEAASASDVWAVGVFGRSEEVGGEPELLILHWDGTGWSRVPAPPLGDLTDISQSWELAALSPEDVWAVGAYFSASRKALTMRWDGSAWRLVPNPLAASLTDVDGTAPDEVWAIGTAVEGAVGRPLIEHWDGSEWSAVPSPEPSPAANGLVGLAAVSASDVWAVGSYQPSLESPLHQELIEHWDGRCWATAPFVCPDATPPEITSAVLGTVGKNGWHVSDVSVSWKVSDPESPIYAVGCQTTEIVSDTSAITLTCEARSAGGTASQGLTVKRDATDPVLTCQTPAPTLLLQGTGGEVDAQVTDATSGPAQAIVSAAADVSSAGRHSLSLTGYDLAGNETMTNCDYLVGYRFLGFFRPLGRAVYEAGVTIPLRFALANAPGERIPDGEAASLAASCGVRIGFAGGAHRCASYDLASDIFRFNLKTSRALAPGAYKVSARVSVGDDLVTTKDAEVMIRR